MKKFGVLLLCSCFVLVWSGLAEAQTKTARDKKGGGCGLYSKFYGNCKTVLKNSEELGISDAQRDEVKNLKYETKRNKIKACAEIDLACVDVSKALWKEEVNVDEVNELIDRKYQLKAQLKKDMVGSYVALNDLLTPEQRAKVKTLRKSAKCDKGYKMDKRPAKPGKEKAVY